MTTRRAVRSADRRFLDNSPPGADQDPRNPEFDEDFLDTICRLCDRSEIRSYAEAIVEEEVKEAKAIDEQDSSEMMIDERIEEVYEELLEKAKLCHQCVQEAIADSYEDE